MRFVVEEIKGLFNVYELLKYLVSSDLKVLYRNKVLGVLWAVLDPLFMMMVYIILVSVVFQRGGPDYPVLLLCGLLPYRWFSSTITSSTKVLITNARLIQTVKIANIVFPVYQSVKGLINFLIGCSILIPMLIIFEVPVSPHILWVIPIIALQFLFITGLSLIVAYVGLYFRDLENILVFGLKIGLYLSPVLYSLDSIPAAYRSLYLALNPFASLFYAYKNVLVRGTFPGIELLIFVGYTIVFVLLGLYIFHVKQKNFAKDV